MATVLFGCVYFASSSFMLLVNKLVVTFIPAPVTLTTVQYIAAAVFVYIGSKCLTAMEADTSFKLDVVKRYIAIPFLFSLAIFSNMKVLETANVETFMVFRFSTPISVALVDFALMGKSLPSLRTWLSFILIVSGAVFYTMTDEGFSVKTYFWISIYLVTITAEMIVVKHIFSTIKMTNWTRVFLNNSLSLLFQPFFYFLTREDKQFPLEKEVPIVGWVYLVLSSFLGIVLAWSGTALRARISATSFTVVGVACKVVTELVNLVMWDKHANETGLSALLVCFIGSLIFVPSPTRNKESTISNAIWTCLNKMMCGALKFFELESPEFVEAAHVEAKYAPVRVEEEGMEILKSMEKGPEQDEESGLAQKKQVAH